MQEVVRPAEPAVVSGRRSGKPFGDSLADRR
jgi:hypothetical protein